MSSALPDDIWRKVLGIGVRVSGLTFRDLCCLSISCRRFNRLSGEDLVWSRLLDADFPSQNSSSSSSSFSSSSEPCRSLSSKRLYRTRFEREKRRKVAELRRAVLCVESDIAVRSKTIRELRLQLVKEEEKLKATLAELANVERIRQASTALNVWQPEVVRGWQKQIVEQSAVPVESRVRALEMELRVCRTQIAVASKAYKEQKQKLELSKQHMGYLRYHPFKLETGVNDARKLRKFKKSNKLEAESLLKIEESEQQESSQTKAPDSGHCSNS